MEDKYSQLYSKPDWRIILKAFATGYKKLLSKSNSLKVGFALKNNFWKDVSLGSIIKFKANTSLQNVQEKHA